MQRYETNNCKLCLHLLSVGVLGKFSGEQLRGGGQPPDGNAHRVSTGEAIWKSPGPASSAGVITLWPGACKPEPDPGYPSLDRERSLRVFWGGKVRPFEKPERII